MFLRSWNSSCWTTSRKRGISSLWWKQKRKGKASKQASKPVSNFNPIVEVTKEELNKNLNPIERRDERTHTKNVLDLKWKKNWQKKKKFKFHIEKKWVMHLSKLVVLNIWLKLRAREWELLWGATTRTFSKTMLSKQH